MRNLLYTCNLVYCFNDIQTGLFSVTMVTCRHPDETLSNHVCLFLYMYGMDYRKIPKDPREASSNS